MTAPAVLAEALSGRGAALTTVVPELAGELARPVRGDLVEVRVFDAVLHVLERLGRERPLMVVIDDAQWADAWSVRLLEYLAGHARDLRLTVVVTLRAGSGERGEPDLAVLAGLSRSGRLLAVELDGLGVADVAALVAARTGRVLDAASTTALCARTDGNPFYVGEIARLVGDGDPTVTALPDTVRGVIGQRLATLPSADADLLAVGAVVGRAFDLDLVTEVSRLDEETVDDIVDRAVRSGLLRDEPTDEGDLRFTHALLAETLLDEIGPSRGRRLHRRIAAALTERRRAPAGRIPAADRIARHLVAVGGDADIRTAVALMLEAADEALRRRSVPEVERLLGDALSAAERLGHGADALVGVVRARQIAFENVIHGPNVLERRTEPQDAELAVDGPDLLAVAYARWTWPMTRGRMHVALRMSDELMTVARERDDDLLLFGALVMQGTDHFVSGRFGATRDACVRAAALADRVDVPPLLFAPHPAISIAFWRAMSLLVLGSPDEARDSYEEVARRGDALRDSVNEAYTAGFEVYWWTFRGDAARAEDAACAARDTIARAGVTGLEYFMAMPGAWAVGGRDLARGLELAEAADRLVSGPDSLSFRPLFRALHADLLLRAGDHTGAGRAVARGLDESAANGAVFLDAELHRLRSLILAASGASVAEVVAARGAARTIAQAQGAVLFLERLAADEARG